MEEEERRGSISTLQYGENLLTLTPRDCQGLIQGAGLSLENKEDILDRWT